MSRADECRRRSGRGLVSGKPQYLSRPTSNHGYGARVQIVGIVTISSTGSTVAGARDVGRRGRHRRGGRAARSGSSRPVEIHDHDRPSSSRRYRPRRPPHHFHHRTSPSGSSPLHRSAQRTFPGERVSADGRCSGWDNWFYHTPRGRTGTGESDRHLAESRHLHFATVSGHHEREVAPRGNSVPRDPGRAAGAATPPGPVTADGRNATPSVWSTALTEISSATRGADLTTPSASVSSGGRAVVVHDGRRNVSPPAKPPGPLTVVGERRQPLLAKRVNIWRTLLTSSRVFEAPRERMLQASRRAVVTRAGAVSVSADALTRSSSSAEAGLDRGGGDRRHNLSMLDPAGK
jgi:hypothetical protein